MNHLLMKIYIALVVSTVFLSGCVSSIRGELGGKGPPPPYKPCTSETTRYCLLYEGNPKSGTVVDLKKLKDELRQSDYVRVVKLDETTVKIHSPSLGHNEVSGHGPQYESEHGTVSPWIDIPLSDVKEIILLDRRTATEKKVKIATAYAFIPIYVFVLFIGEVVDKLTPDFD